MAYHLRESEIRSKGVDCRRSEGLMLHLHRSGKDLHWKGTGVRRTCFRERFRTCFLEASDWCIKCPCSQKPHSVKNKCFKLYRCRFTHQNYHSESFCCMLSALLALSHLLCNNSRRLLVFWSFILGGIEGVTHLQLFSGISRIEPLVCYPPNLTASAWEQNLETITKRGI